MIDYSKFWHDDDKLILRLMTSYCHELGYKQEEQLGSSVYFIKDKEWIKVGMGKFYAIIYKIGAELKIIPLNKYLSIEDRIKQIKTKINET